ncbi:LOW QUALITY PROTEIN: hypothetical protein V2J09_008242 [Rumex salicifolius]
MWAQIQSRMFEHREDSLISTGPDVVDGLTRHIYYLGPGNDPNLERKIQSPDVLDNEWPQLFADDYLSELSYRQYWSLEEQLNLTYVALLYLSTSTMPEDFSHAFVLFIGGASGPKAQRIIGF